MRLSQVHPPLASRAQERVEVADHTANVIANSSETFYHVAERSRRDVAIPFPDGFVDDGFGEPVVVGFAVNLKRQAISLEKVTSC